MVEGWLWGRREECEGSDWECSLEKGSVEMPGVRGTR